MPRCSSRPGRHSRSSCVCRLWPRCPRAGATRTMMTTMPSRCRRGRQSRSARRHSRRAAMALRARRWIRRHGFPGHCHGPHQRRQRRAAQGLQFGRAGGGVCCARLAQSAAAALGRVHRDRRWRRCELVRAELRLCAPLPPGAGTSGRARGREPRFGSVGCSRGSERALPATSPRPPGFHHGAGWPWGGRCGRRRDDWRGRQWGCGTSGLWLAARGGAGGGDACRLGEGARWHLLTFLASAGCGVC